MTRSSARALAAAVVFASAVGACAALQGLDQFALCESDCDAGGSGPEASGQQEATSVDDSSSEAGDDGAAPADDGSGADAYAADAGDTDGSEGGDGGMIDAGGFADATDGGDGAAGNDAAGDSGNGRDASDGGFSSDSGGDAADAGAHDASDGGGMIDAGDGGPVGCPAFDGGLVGYYPFEGSALDQSGNGNNGLAVTGTDVTYGAGKLGQAATIRPGGQGVALTGGTSLSGAKTLCAWVNPATGTIGASLPVFVGGPNTGSNFYDIETTGLQTAGTCSVGANTLFMDNGACSTTTLAVTPGSWNFVCYAYSVGSTTFFANGAAQTVSGNQYDPYFVFQITIGSNKNGGTATAALFAGAIDEVSIWSTALSAATMGNLYNGGRGCRVR